MEEKNNKIEITLNIESLIDKIAFEVHPCTSDCLSELQRHKDSILHYLTTRLTEELNNAISTVEGCSDKYPPPTEAQ